MLKLLSATAALLFLGVAMLPVAAAESATQVSVLALDADGRVLAPHELEALIHRATLEATVAAHVGGPVEIEMLDAIPAELAGGQDLLTGVATAQEADKLASEGVGLVFLVIFIAMAVLLIVIFTAIPLASAILTIVGDAAAGLCKAATSSCPIQ